jgi:hypothetical protein
MGSLILRIIVQAYIYSWPIHVKMKELHNNGIDKFMIDHVPLW